jgi:hypothetical protein
MKLIGAVLVKIIETVEVLFCNQNTIRQAKFITRLTRKSLQAYIYNQIIVIIELAGEILKPTQSVIIFTGRNCSIFDQGF